MSDTIVITDTTMSAVDVGGTITLIELNANPGISIIEIGAQGPPGPTGPTGSGGAGVGYLLITAAGGTTLNPAGPTYVECDCTLGNQDIVIPDPANGASPAQLQLVRIDASPNTITVHPVNGGSIVLSDQYEVLDMVRKNNLWRMV